MYDSRQPNSLFFVDPLEESLLKELESQHIYQESKLLKYDLGKKREEKSVQLVRGSFVPNQLLTKSIIQLIYSFVIFDSWGRNQVCIACCSSQTAHKPLFKPVWKRSQEALRATCPIHVVTFTLISNLATDCIQKRREEARFFFL